MIKRLGQLKYFLYTALITASATLLTLYLNRFGIGREIVLMIFLVGVFETTILTKGYRYSILAALLSAVIFSYFYSNPIYSFMIEKPGDIILLALFMIFAMITSRLATKLQKQAELARRNERAAKFMSEVTESFINVSGEENVVILGLSHIYRYTGCGCSVSLTDGEKQFFPDQTQSENSPCLMQPLRSVGKDLGTVKIFTEKPALPPTEGRIARVVVSQMALALDRELVRRDQEKTRIAMEHERVKSSLLRAISHDLRTPLTGIVGASGLLCDSYESLDPESVKKLLHDINEEALWLVRLVENILNMTRISEGKLKIHKDTEVVDDIVNEALTHVPGLASSGRLSLVLPGNLVSLPMDGILIVQVLTNLLDNALKHTNEESEIILRVYTENKDAVFEVQDDGPGIDESLKKNIFESFTSGSANDSSHGVGLGLSVCKAIVEAHGGFITAGNLPGHGAIFRFTLPLDGGPENGQQ